MSSGFSLILTENIILTAKILFICQKAADQIKHLNTLKIVNTHKNIVLREQIKHEYTFPFSVLKFLGRKFDMGQKRLTDSHLSLITLRYCHIKDVFRG